MNFQLNNLKIQRGAFSLGPINFEMQARGLYWIVGPNGSGKSTLIQAMMGKLKPSSGMLLGFEKPCYYVGIESSLMGSWTVQDNIDWFEDLGGFQMKSDLRSRLLRFYPHVAEQLSHGQRKQIELSLALSSSYQTIFLDEAFNSLDREQHLFFKEEVRQFVEHGGCVVMTSHNHEEFDLPHRGILQL